ncbi:MAG: hypothetical protein JST11_06350 [Acidobacteria bacterium]|nr:hypothetical protein [Acidobacteriota bacterium]
MIHIAHLRRLADRFSRLFRAALAIAAFGALALQTCAAGEAYLGTWKITSAMVAPWWEGSGHKPYAAEMKSLVGKTVTIAANAIRGPRELACTGVRYVVKDYPAAMLFQGAFDEIHRRNPSADPVKIAATVGFGGSTTWKTLETGCAVEIDYHFIDRNTAAFGLNDYIYILKRQ